MAWFPDCAPCSYFGEEVAASLKSIGWLERGHDFKHGRTDRIIYDRLLKLCRDPWQPFVAIGVHECDLCCYEPLSSNGSNVFIPGNGFLFVCPAMITHYMNGHAYLPPDDFCAAVLSCPEMRSIDYMRAILSNGGRSLVCDKPDSKK